MSTHKKDEAYLSEYNKLKEFNIKGLSYTLRDSEIEAKNESFIIMQRTLKKVGINIEIATRSYGSYLNFNIDADKYLKAIKRNAGKPETHYKFETNELELKGTTVMYSDVVYYMQTMTDKEIMDKIGIQRATFYRHKKDMLKSDYYDMLDKNRLSDYDYLKGVEFTLWDEKF